MAVLTGALTLADIRSRMEPGDKKYARIVEVLEQTNEILDDMLWIEGNLLTGHRTNVRTGLPQGTWRYANSGVAETKSSTAVIDFSTGELADRISSDKALAELGGDVAGHRAGELTAHLMGLSNQFAETLFYGDKQANPTTDLPKFDGLSAFYKDDTTALTKENIIDAGGSGVDNTSIWLVGWGERAVHGIYPKGMKAGLQHEDLGIGDAFDASGRRYRAYMDALSWHCGLAIADWRFAVRIANVDVSDLASTPASRQALINHMVAALEKLPNQTLVKPCFYMNGKVRTALRLGIREDVKAGGGLTYDTVAGKQVMRFDGVPVKKCDAIVNTEAAVS